MDERKADHITYQLPFWKYIVVHKKMPLFYDFFISQGSVATVLRGGGQNYSRLRQVFLMPHAIFLKIGQCFTELFKK